MHSLQRRHVAIECEEPECERSHGESVQGVKQSGQIAAAPEGRGGVTPEGVGQNTFLITPSVVQGQLCNAPVRLRLLHFYALKFPSSFMRYWNPWQANPNAAVHLHVKPCPTEPQPLLQNAIHSL